MDHTVSQPQETPALDPIQTSDSNTVPYSQSDEPTTQKETGIEKPHEYREKDLSQQHDQSQDEGAQIAVTKGTYDRSRGEGAQIAVTKGRPSTSCERHRRLHVRCDCPEFASDKKRPFRHSDIASEKNKRKKKKKKKKSQKNNNKVLVNPTAVDSSTTMSFLEPINRTTNFYHPVTNPISGLVSDPITSLYDPVSNPVSGLVSDPVTSHYDPVSSLVSDPVGSLVSDPISNQTPLTFESAVTSQNWSYVQIGPFVPISVPLSNSSDVTNVTKHLETEDSLSNPTTTSTSTSSRPCGDFGKDDEEEDGDEEDDDDEIHFSTQMANQYPYFRPVATPPTPPSLGPQHPGVPCTSAFFEEVPANTTLPSLMDMNAPVCRRRKF
eukprot:CAMPEP_0184655360 /NCGR_PEP_ID=MMETSP0308-20130426/12967_1 /TAXON_ID=38269 /ORGANISM="Gloeochaete witrockiana, Strain SAG 46.84" /LENGTH=379 /DNA_ID=CAMNT_0027091777 /DNA_START=276 /DNA_END=1415 /DNA_ORIENTATION=+